MFAFSCGTAKFVFILSSKLEYNDLNMNNKIDFVVTWVDDSDPEWLKEKKQYIKETKLPDNQDFRYRDLGTFKYWFRAVESYAPWVNKIHFITWGHLPKWLNTKHEKLNIIKHSDYIPADYLPTFNSNVIELNIHRIKELNEQFVLFNDDVFINDYVSEEFFFKNSLPRGSAIFTPIIPENGFAYILLNNLLLLKKYFNKEKSIKQNFRKFFNFQYGFHTVRNIIFNLYHELLGFKEFHVATSILKSTLIEIWEKEEILLDYISKKRFRSHEDINQYLIKNWQFMSGKFEPINPNYTKCFGLNSNNSQIIKTLRNESCKIICINDFCMNFDFEKAKAEIIRAFEEKFPSKSTFEL